MLTTVEANPYSYAIIIPESKGRGGGLKPAEPPAGYRPASNLIAPHYKESRPVASRRLSGLEPPPPLIQENNYICIIDL